MLFDLTRSLRPGTMVSVGVRPESNSLGWVRPWLWQTLRVLWPPDAGAYGRNSGRTGATTTTPFHRLFRVVADSSKFTWIGNTSVFLMARVGEAIATDRVADVSHAQRIEIWEAEGNVPLVANSATISRRGTAGANISHVADLRRIVPSGTQELPGNLTRVPSWMDVVMARLFQMQGMPFGIETVDGEQRFGILGPARVVSRGEAGRRYSWIEVYVMGPVSGSFKDDPSVERWDSHQYQRLPAAVFGGDTGWSLGTGGRGVAGATGWGLEGKLLAEWDCLAVDQGERDFGFRDGDTPDWSASLDGLLAAGGVVTDEAMLPRWPELPNPRGPEATAPKVWSSAGRDLFANWFRQRDVFKDARLEADGRWPTWRGFTFEGTRGDRQAWLPGTGRILGRGGNLTGWRGYWESLAAAVLEVEDVGYLGGSVPGDVETTDSTTSPFYWLRMVEGHPNGTLLGGTRLRGILRGWNPTWPLAAPRFAMLLPLGQGFVRSWWEIEESKMLGDGAAQVSARLYRPSMTVSPITVLDAWAPYAQFASLAGTVVSDDAWEVLRSGEYSFPKVVDRIGAARLVGGWDCSS